MSDRMLGNIGTASESKRVTTHGIINTNIGGTGSHERQHLIPQQVYKKSQFLQDIGFNVDSHWNGIFDKNMNKGITTVNDIFKANNGVVSETHCIKDEIFAYREESSRRDCSVPKAVTSFW